MAAELEERAKVWLNAAQKQRLHWSTMVTTLMGFVVVAVAGVGSYLVPKYIEAAAAKPAYFLVWAAVSSLVLGLWRIYTGYIDKNIAGLYPELVYCEAILETPEGMGVSGYLTREVPPLAEVFSSRDSLSADEKRKVIKDLVKSKRIGSRGHSTINKILLFCISVNFLVGIGSVYYTWDAVSQFECKELCLHLVTYAILLLSVLIGLALISIAECKSPKDPTAEDVQETIRKVKEAREQKR